jgi:hypothetical protein
MGRAFGEGKLIELAYAFEQATLHRRAPILIPEPAGIQLFAAAALAGVAGRPRRRTFAGFIACKSLKESRLPKYLRRFFEAFGALVL